MRLTGPDGSELMTVEAITSEGGKLVISGRIMGALPMTAILTPEEAKAGFGFLKGRLLWFLLKFAWAAWRAPGTNATSGINNG